MSLSIIPNPINKKWIIHKISFVISFNNIAGAKFIESSKIHEKFNFNQPSTSPEGPKDSFGGCLRHNQQLETKRSLRIRIIQLGAFADTSYDHVHEVDLVGE